jgi:hypothetical protein
MSTVNKAWKLGKDWTCYSTHRSKFHSMDCSNMQLFLLLDQGERSYTLICFWFNMVGPFKFLIVDLVIHMFMFQKNKNCISNIIFWKTHIAIWDAPCTKNDVNNKSFLLLVWQKPSILFQILIPIMRQNISQ